MTEQNVSRHLDAVRRLVLLLDTWSQPFDGFHRYYPNNRVAVPALRALTDAIRRSG